MQKPWGLKVVTPIILIMAAFVFAVIAASR